jgi:hypothetical protein
MAESMIKTRLANGILVEPSSDPSFFEAKRVLEEIELLDCLIRIFEVTFKLSDQLNVAIRII